MSRGFVKEEDQETVPIVPPRPALPEGVVNYVTCVGMNELLAEKESLISEKDNLDSTNENEKRIAVNYINAKLQSLNKRIASARAIDLNDQPKDEIRFGAWVTLEIDKPRKTQKYQIVGIDEADISKGKISFISPIAKLLNRKKVGDKVTLKLAKGERVFKVIEICYSPDLIR
ncbi:MAG: GreA/GreB family elongation factor [Cyclobacteriaceae bacterium]